MNFKSYEFDLVTSTNDKAKSFAREGKFNLAVISKRQLNGRGRLGRKWFSGEGGVYMTLVLKEKNLDTAKYLTLIASVAIVKTMGKLTKLNSKVKWPNDVLINNRKVCGILTETYSGKDNFTLVGIGLNVNQGKFPKNISNKATSLKIETGRHFNLKNLSKLIIKEFNLLYGHYNNKNYYEIIDIWKRCSHTLGRKVKVKTVKKTYIGKAVDVDQDCNLILKLDNGKLKKIIEGDIFLS